MPKVLVSEEDWLVLGIEYFSVGGVKALKVEKMAAALQCSKSSFYWYFKNRVTFVKRMLDYWVNIGTQSLIAESKAALQPLPSLLYQVFTERRGRDFLFYLRQLAETDEYSATILKKTEQERIGYVRLLLEQAGLDARLAKEKSAMIYHYYLGWYERHKYIDDLDLDLEAQQQIKLLSDHFQLPLMVPGRVD